MRKCLCLLISTLLCTTTFAFEKLTLICNIEGTKVSLLHPNNDEFLSERIQIDIEPFLASSERPDLSFLSYKIIVRGSPPLMMTMFAPENSVTKILNGHSFENKSNLDVLEFQYKDGKNRLQELRIDRKTGFLEAHTYIFGIHPLNELSWGQTVRYTGNCIKQVPSKNLF